MYIFHVIASSFLKNFAQLGRKMCAITLAVEFDSHAELYTEGHSRQKQNDDSTKPVLKHLLHDSKL